MVTLEGYYSLLHFSARFFLQIRLTEKKFRLISGLAEFYETDKICLKQENYMYIHHLTTNLVNNETDKMLSYRRETTLQDALGYSLRQK